MRIDAGVITENACWISFACLSSIDEINSAFFVEDKPARRIRIIPLESLRWRNTKSPKSLSDVSKMASASLAIAGLYHPKCQYVSEGRG